MTGVRSVFRYLIAFVLAGVVAPGCRPASRSDTGARATSATVPKGGELIVSIRTEPRSFNRLAARDTSTDLIGSLLHGKLVRINHVTEDVEPWLAESWTRSDDGLQYRVKLRPNVTFADGHPFSAEDVIFSFAAAYDEKSAVSDALQIGGKKIAVTAADPSTIVLTFPSPFAPGVRILDNLPILPRHKLEHALKNRSLDTAWGLSTPPSEITGLGPFGLVDYKPGQRLVFSRNLRYWRKDAAGVTLPYVDRLILDIVPDENTEVLRLEAGQSDMTASEVPTVAYATLKRAAEAGRVTLVDLGVGYESDSFWFNLKPGAFAGDSRRGWLQRDELRRAISMGVDRQLFADTVFLGAAVPVFGPVTPANRKWYSADAPHTPHDPAGARQLLTSIGLADRNGDGVLEDAGGRPARFTIITQKGRPSLERGVAVIRDELKKIGLLVDAVTLDGNAVIERILSASYDAVYFHPLVSDTDPASTPDFWFSSGSGHFWNIAQQTPATDWERRIDELMSRQVQTPDERERKQIFAEVQKIFAEHEPVIYFAAPRVFVAMSKRVVNVVPAVWRPQLLWSPDTVAVRH